jgi:hypothetical protein
LIEENDGSSWKPLFPCRLDGNCRVKHAERSRIGKGLELPIQPPVEQNEESKAT